MDISKHHDEYKTDHILSILLWVIVFLNILFVIFFKYVFNSAYEFREILLYAFRVLHIGILVLLLLNRRKYQLILFLYITLIIPSLLVVLGLVVNMDYYFYQFTLTSLLIICFYPYKDKSLVPDSHSLVENENMFLKRINNSINIYLIIQVMFYALSQIPTEDINPFDIMIMNPIIHFVFCIYVLIIVLVKKPKHNLSYKLYGYFAIFFVLFIPIGNYIIPQTIYYGSPEIKKTILILISSILFLIYQVYKETIMRNHLLSDALMNRLSSLILINLFSIFLFSLKTYHSIIIETFYFSIASLIVYILLCIVYICRKNYEQSISQLIFLSVGILAYYVLLSEMITTLILNGVL